MEDSLETYHPLRTPDPEAWLAMDEQERIALVELRHEDERVELDNVTLHAVIHVIVENQLAMQDEDVRQTLDRLMAEGLDRHDALHAVGSVLAEHLWGVMNEPTEDDASPERY
ncbi:MAG: DUF1841 family protein, partial [Planctomycetota bacterium]